MTTLHLSSIWKLQMVFELPIYKSAGGLFGIDFAKPQTKTLALGEKNMTFSFQISFNFKL